MFCYIKGILRIFIGQILIVWMLANIVLIRKERSCAADLQDTLAAIHGSKLIPRHQLPSDSGIVRGMGRFPTSGFTA
jgi:hypothetical protein